MCMTLGVTWENLALEANNHCHIVFRSIAGLVPKVINIV